eukprot:8104747-Lingulodinium_polyedra.AAC.1
MDAVGRMGRLACLLLPFDARCHMGAAAGTAAGMYGATRGPPPARELAALRRAAKDAACHGANRCANE